MSKSITDENEDESSLKGIEGDSIHDFATLPAYTKSQSVYDTMIKMFEEEKEYIIVQDHVRTASTQEYPQYLWTFIIAECQKECIFLDYADLEMRIGNEEQCRKFYGKFLNRTVKIQDEHFQTEDQNS